MSSSSSAAAAPPGLERKIALSRWALGFERVWPRLWLPIGVLSLFLIASLAGVWPLLGSAQHGTVIAAFGLAFAASVLPIARLRWPTRSEALQRLESLSGLPHRPATSYEDQLPGDAPPPGPTASLWAAHRQRLAWLIGGLKPRPPQPRTQTRDPFALRALILLALAVTGVGAGDAFSDRLGAAFRFGPAIAAVPTRLDAWVTPPAYTGRQPILLTEAPLAASTAGDASAAIRKFEVPNGSVLTVRAAGPAHGNFTVEAPALLTEQAKSDPASLLSEFRDKLDASKTVRVLDSGAERFAWQFKVIPDLPPVIALTKEPQQTPRGALVLDYRATDDYGVASAEARFALAEAAASKSLKLADGSQIEPLGESPKMPLKLGKSPSMKDVKGRTSIDLSAHLWAGLKVRITLAATDHGGHTGTAEAAHLTLPERQFRNPLARAVIEQRRKLAFSPGDYLDVRYALDALAIAPERFPIDPASYLSLRTAYRELKETPSTELFKTVTDQLWDLAQRLESGEMSVAEQALKDAEDKLAKALEEGASDAEIKQRMAELRQALSKFLQELAQQPAKPGQMAPGQELSQQDLDQMLQKMEQLSQSGNKSAAQQMLAEMRDLLDRLQSGKMAKGGPDGKMRQMLDKFGNLIGKQKKLLDDTFKTGRERRNGDGPGKGQKQGQGQGKGQVPGQPGDLGELGQRQGDLQGELDGLMQDLQGSGAPPPDPLKGAGKSMGDARDSLNNEDPDTAAENQGKALDQLRKGAQALAEQMQKNQGQQQGNNRDGKGNRDPLGRKTGQDSQDDNGLDNGADLNIDGRDVQRSRQIIEELRKRLGETTRPPGELDYLERLLK